jgi:hypothetical protein
MRAAGEAGLKIPSNLLRARKGRERDLIFTSGWSTQDLFGFTSPFTGPLGLLLSYKDLLRMTG